MRVLCCQLGPNRSKRSSIAIQKRWLLFRVWLVNKMKFRCLSGPNQTTWRKHPCMTRGGQPMWRSQKSGYLPFKTKLKKRWRVCFKKICSDIKRQISIRWPVRTAVRKTTKTAISTTSSKSYYKRVNSPITRRDSLILTSRTMMS